jgi:hypothetical protein
LPDFPWYKKPKWKNIPNDHKIYRMATELSNGRKIDQHKALQGPRIFTQIGIFGLKMYYLATLVEMSALNESDFNNAINYLSRLPEINVN